MKIIGNKLDFFSELYEEAKNRCSAEHARMEQHLKQYKGDAAIDGSTEAASAVRNITYELIESQVSSEIPAPRVTAVRYNEHHNRNAISAERLLNQIRDRLPFEMLNDIDERYTYIFGGSVWLVEWDDNAGDRTERGGVRISVISPQDFFPQPNVWREEDLEYAFFRYNSTTEDVYNRYGVEVDPKDTELDTDITEHPDAEGTLTVVVCYYKRDGRVCKYVFSGETELEDIDDYYARRIKRCKKCGKPEGDCICERPKFVTEYKDEETLYEDIALADGTVIPANSPAMNDDGTIKTQKIRKPVIDQSGMPLLTEIGGIITAQTEETEEPVMEATKIPYFVPDVFPFVIRRNVSAHQKLFGQSDSETLRPTQQAINKVESRLMQKLMRAAVTPIVPEDAQITTNNSIFGQVIRLRPGETANQYGTVDTTPNIQQDIIQGDRLYEHAKSLLGITNSYRGEADYAGQSGKAVQALMQQSAGRLESKRRMKRAAYADLDRIIWQMYLAYSDEPRRMQYVDEMGFTQDAIFSRYDFLDMDPLTGKWHYYDGYTFSTDNSGGMEQQREVLWETNLTNFKQGSFGDPADPRTALRYWMMQERAHYPHASDNVAYFKSIVQQLTQAQQPQQMQQQEVI